MKQLLCSIPNFYRANKYDINRQYNKTQVIERQAIYEDKEEKCRKQHKGKAIVIEKVFKISIFHGFTLQFSRSAVVASVRSGLRVSWL